MTASQKEFNIPILGNDSLDKNTEKPLKTDQNPNKTKGPDSEA